MGESNVAGLEGLLANIKDSISELTKLKIITAVGQVAYKHGDSADTADDANNKEMPVTVSESKAIYSCIDLLQGDNKTFLDAEFVTGNYQDLKAFHQSREEQGQEIIKKNIEALENLIELLVKVKDKEPPNGNN